MPIELVLITSGALALLVTPMVIRLAARLQLYDRPGGRRIHAAPVPRLGGVAVFVGTVVALTVAALRTPLSSGQQRLLLAIFLGGGSLFLAGLVDDLRGLRPSVKLGVECGAALMVCLLGLEIDVIGLGSAGTVATGHLAIPLTVLWIVGVTNAFNLIDGLDGLATGIALVALGTVLVTAHMFGSPAVMIAAAALLGGLLGFGRYNLPPARIFLGDSGSLFVGFFLAVLSVEASIKSTTVVLVIVPLCALALPLIDMTLAIARRWLRGSSIFSADARHIHHRLLALGLRPGTVLAILLLAAAAFAVVAVLVVVAPQQAQLAVGLAGGILVLALALIGIRRLKYHEFHEAKSAVLDVLHARQAVHERICAHEATDRLRDARTLTQVNAIMRDSATELGFLRMEVVPASVARDLGRYDEAAPRVWTFQCALGNATLGHGAHVLCISGDGHHDSRFGGAERLAQVFVPRLEAWFAKRALVTAQAEVSIVHAEPEVVDARHGDGKRDRGSLELHSIESHVARRRLIEDPSARDGSFDGPGLQGFGAG